jgi:DNA modification methylase
LIEEKQYGDIWDKDEYLQFMFDRLVLMRELLSESGTIYLHCDWHKNAYIRLVMDEVFGEENFTNEIIWYYWNKFQMRDMKSYARNHDNILVYSKNRSQAKFYPQTQPLDRPKKLKRIFWDAEKGRIQNRKDEEGRVVYDDVYDEKVDDVWDLPYLGTTSKERSDYPTQKPEELVERIIRSSSEVGDLVLDCFVGSGTTAAAAQKMGRRWIACDINIGAIQTTTKRLNQITEAQLQGETDKDAWSLPTDGIGEAKNKTLFGFKVFNVNEYDVFKNEIEAQEIIIEMYGVERARMNYFDGVLDNRFVKVMPLNRVLSKKDMDTVIKGIKDNLDSFAVKTKSRHGEAVYEQGVTVFCSGLELDALDYLKKKNDTGVEVDVRDILLDKQGVIFKQKPEAEVSVKPKGGKVTVKIDDFISPILMRKLEIENDKALKKEAKAKVEDFRQIIDSVAIDVDYDGKLFNAEIIDVPAKNELIKAEYEIEYAKKGKQTLAIKIVDVLGEEYFETFEATV